MPDLRPSSSRALPLAVCLLLSLLVASGFTGCDEEVLESGAQLFLSPQQTPLALSNDGQRLFVANTTSGTVSVLDVSNPLAPSLLAEIHVGLDPVSVAVRPPAPDGRDLVLVSNHVSDSITVIDAGKLAVVQTLQGLDAEGVTTTDEPVGLAFSGPERAFVALDHSNQVLAIDFDAAGKASLNPQRLDITAQAPRAVTAAYGRLYVASFESGNMTEFSMCGPADTRGLAEDDQALTDEGCDFELDIVRDLSLNDGLVLGTVFEFAAQNPNIGGRVVRDTDIPDRDVFVYDATTLALEQVVDTVGTMLNGLAVGPAGQLYVTHTEARNHLDGLGALDNRLFENRLAILDCSGGSCGAPTQVDLDASAAPLGQTVPTPYGVAVSQDGANLVVTASSADGDPGDGRAALHGLFTLDAAGNVLGSALTGALPEGVALRSGPAGAAQTAFVLNSADSTVSVVDVSDPTAPQTRVAAFVVGDDPTPDLVRRGRIAFSTARGSTNHTFACASCHPHGNIDQLLWTINAVQGPDDGPNAVGEFAEPRNSMPIRGLRDTLPLHWEGTLADPVSGVNPLAVFDSAPDCDLEADGEVGCVAHLVDAALSGPMCQHNGPQGCVPGPGQLGPDGSARKGALTDSERHAMAAFQLAVAFPPAPSRRPDDRLSDAANLGVQDFFTDEDGLGIRGGVGETVNFAPATCADNPMGCHSLPLTVSTNSSVVGGFDAPSARGMWDRWTQFSNGISTSEEVLRAMQDCADGIEPPAKTVQVVVDANTTLPVDVFGDPCNLRSPLLTAFLGFEFAELPFPSGAEVYDPAVGMTERGSFLSSFEVLFALVYGVRGENIWEFQVEMSTGLPGLTGRQLQLDPENLRDGAVGAALAQIEDADRQGKVEAVARGAVMGEFRFDGPASVWQAPSGYRVTSLELRQLTATVGDVVTVTAELPAGMSIGGPDRQPLLDIDPDLRVLEANSDAPSLPRPPELQVATFRLGAWYVDPAASVLVNGQTCEGCSFVPSVAGTGDPTIDLTLAPGLPAGVHVLQVLNPDGWASNEMPICVTNGVDVCLGDPDVVVGPLAATP